jgi:hypothetical protein
MRTNPWPEIEPQLRRPAHHPPPPELTERILRRVAAGSPVPPAPAAAATPQLRWAWAGAAAVLALLLWSSQRPAPPHPAPALAGSAVPGLPLAALSARAAGPLDTELAGLRSDLAGAVIFVSSCLPVSFSPSPDT